MRRLADFFLIPALILVLACVLCAMVGCDGRVDVRYRDGHCCPGPCCPNGPCCPAPPPCPPPPRLRIDIDPIIVPRGPAPIIIPEPCPAPHCPPAPHHPQPHKESHR